MKTRFCLSGYGMNAKYFQRNIAMARLIPGIDKDRLFQWLANDILPTRLIYWSTLKGIVLATSGEYFGVEPTSVLWVLTHLNEISDPISSKSVFDRDGIFQWLANGILPIRLLYWCTIRGIALATSGKYSNVSPISAMWVLDNLDNLSDQNKTPPQVEGLISR